MTLLLKAGAKVNVKNLTGKSALELAVDQRAQEVIELLLKYGADPTTCSRQAQDALKKILNEAKSHRR